MDGSEYPEAGAAYRGAAQQYVPRDVCLPSAYPSERRGTSQIGAAGGAWLSAASTPMQTSVRPAVSECQLPLRSYLP